MRRRVALLALVPITIAVAWLIFASPAFDSPQRHVARYLDATGRGDESAALAQWSLYADGPYGLRAPDELVTRRRSLTNQLATDHAGRDYMITAIDWWRTCCTPALIADSANAGLARVHVITAGESGTTYRLVFEVWVKDLTWWGDAAGEWLHDWRLYEVHHEDQSCVFPDPVSGCIHSFD